MDIALMIASIVSNLLTLFATVVLVLLNLLIYLRINRPIKNLTEIIKSANQKIQTQILPESKFGTLMAKLKQDPKVIRADQENAFKTWNDSIIHGKVLPKVDKFDRPSNIYELASDDDAYDTVYDLKKQEDVFFFKDDKKGDKDGKKEDVKDKKEGMEKTEGNKKVEGKENNEGDKKMDGENKKVDGENKKVDGENKKVDGEEKKADKDGKKEEGDGKKEENKEKKADEGESKVEEKKDEAPKTKVDDVDKKEKSVEKKVEVDAEKSKSEMPEKK